MFSSKEQELRRLSQRVKELEDVVRGIAPTEDVMTERLRGRRVFYTMVGTVRQPDPATSLPASATTTNIPRSLPQIRYYISQDGPFVWTHYPLIGLRFNNGTDAGKWRPVTAWPTPDQVSGVTAAADISYEMIEIGADIKTQNDNLIPIPGMLLSYPGRCVPLPRSIIFRASSVIGLTITVHDFTLSEEAETDFTFVAALPGYKIVDQQMGGS